MPRSSSRLTTTEAPSDRNDPTSNPASGSTPSNASKSNDPAWAYAYTKPECRGSLFCKLCHKGLSGGIFRLKQHLTWSKLTQTGGKYNGGQMCPKTTSVIKKEILDYQNEYYKKRIEKARIEREILARESLIDSDEEAEIEVLGSGGQNSSEINSNQLDSIPNTSGVTIGQKRPRADPVKGPMDLFYAPKAKKNGNSKLIQTTMDKECKKILRDRAAYDFSCWMYDAGISFNSVRLESFKKAIESVGHAGPHQKPLSYHEVRVTRLNKKFDETMTFVKEFRVHWEAYGCVIMSDGWTDGKGRTLINFLVNCSKGTIFLKSVDASGCIKNADLLAEMLGNIVEFVGPNNVVQVLTDNASNYVAAGGILMQKYPSLYWGPCTAHCIDLMLEDIGSLPKFDKIVKESKFLSSFIYNRPRVLHLMRAFTKNKELVRPAVTRFATNFLNLESIHNNKDALRQMFVSTRWNQNDWSRKAEGKRVASIVARTSYWTDLVYCLKVLAPLVEVVRIVDAEEKPAMGYIYHAVSRAKELIKRNLNDDPRLYFEYWKIVDERWAEQLHQDLYAAGYYLNPKLYFERGMVEMEADQRIKNHLFKSITRLCNNPIIEDKVLDQLVTYRQARGIMGTAAAVRRRNTTAPAEWWVTYGSDVPELQNLAIRVLSQTVSATPCERNWSVFEHLHSPKRNKLAHKRLNALVYIQYNGRLRRRFQDRLSLRGGETDPILLRDISDCDEWILPADDEIVFDEDERTRRLIQEAAELDNIGLRTRSRTARAQVQEQEQSRELNDEPQDDEPPVQDDESGDDEDLFGRDN